MKIPVRPDPECACCGSDPNLVCDNCHQHDCWAGQFMCDTALHGDAGTARQLGSED